MSETTEPIEIKDAIRTKKEKVKLSVIMHQDFMPSLVMVNNNEDLPAKATYWLGKALNKCKSHLTDFDATRNKAIKKYAKLDDKGEVITEENKFVFKDDDSAATFAKEMTDLLEQEVEVLKVSKDAILKTEAKIKGVCLAAIDEILF